MNPNEATTTPARDIQPKKKTSWLFWVFSIIIILVLASICMPLFLGKRTGADKTKAIGHAKQCLIAFTEFEEEYGALPGQIIADGGKVPGAEAKTSNDCFRQLLQGLVTVRSEAIFFAPSKISKQPDNDIGDASNHFAEACEKGEVGFLYVEAPNALEGAPLMATPLLNASGMFDAGAYKGYGVVLKNDGSVEAVKIDSSTGKILIRVGGKNVDMFGFRNPTLVDPYVIKYPEPR